MVPRHWVFCEDFDRTTITSSLLKASSTLQQITTNMVIHRTMLQAPRTIMDKNQWVCKLVIVHV